MISADSRIMKATMPFKKSVGTCLLIIGLVLSSSEAMALTGARATTKYDSIIRKIASRYRVDAALVHSIIAVESNYNRFAVSGKGAQGLMQLMPGTAEGYGVRDVFNAIENIEGGVKYIKDLQKKYPNQTELVLAAYNAGPTAVNKHGGIPPYFETRNYVAQVKKIIKQEKRIKTTQIYEFIDGQGRCVITNDVRLVPTAGGQKP